MNDAFTKKNGQIAAICMSCKAEIQESRRLDAEELGRTERPDRLRENSHFASRLSRGFSMMDDSYED